MSENVSERVRETLDTEQYRYVQLAGGGTHARNTKQGCARNTNQGQAAIHQPGMANTTAASRKRADHANDAPVAPVVVDEELLGTEAFVAVLIAAVRHAARAALHPLDTLDTLYHQKHALRRELPRAVQVDGPCHGFARHVHRFVRADEAVVACAEAGAHGEEERRAT